MNEPPQYGLVDAREEQLMEVVAADLDKWDPDGISGFEDCKKLFEAECGRLAAAGCETRFITSDAIGTWIVLNLFGRVPQTQEDYTLVRTTGAIVTHAFHDWWTSAENPEPPK